MSDDKDIKKSVTAIEYESISSEGQMYRFMGRIMQSHETMCKMMMSTTETLLAELESRRVNDRDIETRRLELYMRLEEAITLKHERDIQVRREELKEEVAKGLIGDFKALVPPIINKIAGTPLLAQDDKHSLRTLLSQLDDSEQGALEGFLTKLSPAKRMALITLINAADDEEKKEHANGKGNNNGQ